MMMMVASSRDGQARSVYARIAGGTGTGKTRLMHALLDTARAVGATCEAAAFSAKASLKLNPAGGGRTALGLFGINPSSSGCTSTWLAVPLPHVMLLDDAHLLTAAQLSAMHAELERRRFRGLLVIAADASQMGPVVTGRPGEREEKQVSVSVHRAPCWRRFRRYALEEQMRIVSPSLARSVRDIARGRWPSAGRGGHRHSYNVSAGHQKVHLPLRLFPARAVPQFASGGGTVADARQWACSQRGAMSSACQSRAALAIAGCIVCTVNDRVDEHNSAVLQTQGGEMVAYGACVGACAGGGARGSIAPAWVSEGGRGNFCNELRLKPGVPVRLTVNINAAAGLVTDAVATVVELRADSVVIRLAEPVEQGRDVFTLARAPFKVWDEEMPRFTIKRQFPLSLTWAVTAHRAPAFEAQRVLVDLRDSCWLHGQLGVMLSRVRRSSNMLVLVRQESMTYTGDCFETTNVVVSEIVAGMDRGR